MARDCGWGWVVVAAAFMICVLGDGVRYSYGLLYIEFLAEFQRDKGETSWIGSIMFGTYGLAGPLAGVVIARLGCRATVTIGCLIASASFITSMFATSVHYLYFSFGLLGGLGNALMMMPVFVVIVQYFEKKRSLAMGVTVCGSGIGTMIFNPLSKFLIDEYNWRGALLIEAGLLLNGCALASVMRPITNRPEPTKDLQCADTEPEAMVKHTDTVVADPDNQIRGRCDSAAITYPCTTDTSEHTAMLQLNMATSDTTTIMNNIVTPTANAVVKVPTYSSNTLSKKDTFTAGTVIATLKKIYRFELLMNGGIVMCMTATLFFGLAYMTPFIFLPDMVLWMGFTRQDATWMLTTIGIANVVVRVPVGVVSDKAWASRWKLYVGSRMATGLLMAAMVVTRNYTILMVICGLYGLALGTSVVLKPLVLADIFGADLIADSVGLVNFGGGISSLTGPPISGIANVVVRVPVGVVSDKAWASRWKLYVGSRMATGLLMAAMVVTRNYTILMVICGLYGLALGTSVVLKPLVLADIFGADLIADSVGLVNFGGGISSLTGPPISGWMFDVSGAYLITFIVAGAEYCLGAILMMLVPHFQTKR